MILILKLKQHFFWNISECLCYSSGIFFIYALFFFADRHEITMKLKLKTVCQLARISADILRTPREQQRTKPKTNARVGWTRSAQNALKGSLGHLSGSNGQRGPYPQPSTCHSWPLFDRTGQNLRRQMNFDLNKWTFKLNQLEDFGRFNQKKSNWLPSTYLS